MIHIPYIEDNVGIQKYKNEISFGEKFWQFIRFCVITGMIFSILSLPLILMLINK